jgi:methyl-accepting chemotaxis protein
MVAIERGNERIGEIVKVITEIAQKTKIINDIVFQTKLLSFNASVEAAKAGEHGKGFAVVAEEIGNLAQMSGSASKEIAEMLNSSIQKVNGIVQDTSHKVQDFIKVGKTKVDAGTIVARKCGEVLAQVVRNVTEVNLMISDISLAAKDQAKGMNEITNAMVQLDSSTNINSNSVHETAEYSTQMTVQVEKLHGILLDMANEVLLNKSVDWTLEQPDGSADESGATVLKFKGRNSKPRSATNVRRKRKYQTVEAEIPSEKNPDFEDV